MKKITSFCVNHRLLKPGVYISRRDGHVITYDLRVKKPNTGDLMSNVQMHTTEHMLATFLRNGEIAEHIVYFGPMGCQTGFYLLVHDSVSPERVLDAIKQSLLSTLEYEGDVFGASETECGNFRSLELNAAKEVCREYNNILLKITRILTYDDVK